MNASFQPEKRKQDDNSERPALDRLLTPTEVAALTGLSIETLAQWRSQRRGIPYVKLARNVVRYRCSDLDDFVNQCIVRVEPFERRDT
jgi:predicted DNA-binding transcriptional regulator AlpA